MCSVPSLGPAQHKGGAQRYGYFTASHRQRQHQKHNDSITHHDVSITQHCRLGHLGKTLDGRPLSKLSIAWITLTLTNTVGSILFYPLVINLIQIVGCDSEGYLKTYDQNLQCYSPYHLAAVMCMIAAVCLFYPLASFMLPNMQFVNASLDVKFDSTFMVFSAQGKLLLAGIFTFFDEAGVLMGAATVVYITLLLICWTGQPCLVKRVNRWKTLSFAVPAWCHACTLVYVIFGQDTRYNIMTVTFMLAGIFIFATLTQISHFKRWGCGFNMVTSGEADREEIDEKV
jgi:hypothetical protein